MPVKRSSFPCKSNGNGFLKGRILNAKGALCVLSKDSVSDLYLECSLLEQKHSLAAKKQMAQFHTCLLQIKRGLRQEENCSMFRILCTCLLVLFWKKTHYNPVNAIAQYGGAAQNCLRLNAVIVGVAVNVYVKWT